MTVTSAAIAAASFVLILIYDSVSASKLLDCSPRNCYDGEADAISFTAHCLNSSQVQVHWMLSQEFKYSQIMMVCYNASLEDYDYDQPVEIRGTNTAKHGSADVFSTEYDLQQCIYFGCAYPFSGKCWKRNIRKATCKSSDNALNYATTAITISNSPAFYWSHSSRPLPISSQPLSSTSSSSSSSSSSTTSSSSSTFLPLPSSSSKSSSEQFIATAVNADQISITQSVENSNRLLASGTSKNTFSSVDMIYAVFAISIVVPIVVILIIALLFFSCIICVRRNAKLSSISSNPQDYGKKQNYESEMKVSISVNTLSSMNESIVTNLNSLVFVDDSLPAGIKPLIVDFKGQHQINATLQQQPITTSDTFSDSIIQDYTNDGNKHSSSYFLTPSSSVDGYCTYNMIDADKFSTL